MAEPAEPPYYYAECEGRSSPCPTADPGPPPPSSSPSSSPRSAKDGIYCGSKRLRLLACLAAAAGVTVCHLELGRPLTTSADMARRLSGERPRFSLPVKKVPRRLQSCVLEDGFYKGRWRRHLNASR